MGPYFTKQRLHVLGSLVKKYMCLFYHERRPAEEIK